MTTASAAGYRPPRVAKPAASTLDGARYYRERARRESAAAELAELKLAERRGSLVPVAAVRREWESMLAAFRARLLTLPPTAAPLCLAAADVAEAQAILQRLIYQALDELAGSDAI